MNMIYRSSLLLSTSLPSSQQSPEVKRKSWNPALAGSVSSALAAADPTSPDLPINYEDAKAEAMDLICQLNTVYKYKESETGLNKMKGRVPKLFEDLCFYSDVCLALAEYEFRINARKFIQTLFNSVDVGQVIKLKKDTNIAHFAYTYRVLFTSYMDLFIYTQHRLIEIILN